MNELIKKPFYVYNKINQANASVLNRLTVFNIIKEYKVIQRDEIKKITRLQKSTLTYILNDLSNLYLIKQEKAQNTGKKGVAPLNISVNNDEYVVIGINIELDTAKVVVMDLSYNFLYSENFDFKYSQDSFIDKISEIINKVKSTINTKCIAIGLAIPGVIDYANNSLLISNLLGIRELPLGKILSDRFQIPVFIENNANAAAFGEYNLFYKFNQKKEIQNLYYVFFHLTKKHKTKNTGIGSGIIINGEIYYGDYNAAGEIGDIIENIVSENFKDYDMKSFQKDFIGILNEAKKGDRTAIDIVEKFAHSLGFYISNIVNILNTSVVVIGGDYPLAHANFFKSIKDGIHKNLIRFLRDKVQISRSHDEIYGSAKGVAVFAQNKIFSYDYFKKILKLLTKN